MRMKDLIYNEISGEFEEVVTVKSKEYSTTTFEIDNGVYSIKRQFHEKKGKDIFVVKGKEKVNDDIFEEMRAKAKSYGKGYYSSFRGVAGFVFSDMTDAIHFANDVFGDYPEYLRSHRTEPIPKKTKETIEEKSHYSITKQFHESKGIYIYVVKLKDRFDEETFAELRESARQYGKGYYSTFRGVNGFVFYSIDDAKLFADENIENY